MYALPDERFGLWRRAPQMPNRSSAATAYWAHGCRSGQRRLPAAVKRDKLPVGTTTHDLRHHYASVRPAAGESVVAVVAGAERLGHENATPVLTTYRHLMPDPVDRTRRAVDEAWGSAVTVPLEAVSRPLTCPKGRGLRDVAVLPVPGLRLLSAGGGPGRLNEAEAGRVRRHPGPLRRAAAVDAAAQVDGNGPAVVGGAGHRSQLRLAGERRDLRSQGSVGVGDAQRGAERRRVGSVELAVGRRRVAA